MVNSLLQGGLTSYTWWGAFIKVQLDADIEVSRCGVRRVS